MFRFLRMIKFYFHYSIRTRAFTFMIFLNIFIAILISILLLFSSVLLKSFIPGNIRASTLPINLLERLFNFQWANIMIYIPVLSSAFFGSTAIPYEFESRNIYNIVSLPVSRFQILMSKIFGSTILSFLSTMIIVVFQLIFFIIEFKSLPGTTFLYYIILLLLITFSDICFAVATSTFFKNSGHSAIAFLIVYLVIFNILSLIATGSGDINPIFIKTNADRIIYRIFLNSDPYFLDYSVSLSPLSHTLIDYISVILILYSLISILIAYLVFTFRRDFR